MFAANSRYHGLGLYTVTTPDGASVTVVRCATPGPAAPAGYHRRVTNDRLDLLAARYLKDPSAFWRLCDANNAPAPDALAARDLIGIPASGPG